MLEDRLSSAYSQQSLGYGAVPAPQYPSMYPSMPPPPVATDGKTGIENFYYGKPAAEAPPLSPTPYAQHRLERDVPDGTASTMSPGVYPQPSQPAPWNGAAYPPHPVSPPPSNNFQPAYPGQAGPPQYYTAPTLPEQDYTPRPGESETPYQPSPVVQRDSQYFPPAGPPSAAVPSAPEQPPPADQVQSSGYQQYQQQIPETPAMTMGGKPAPPQQPQPQQQPTVPPAQQSYYYPPPPQHQPQQQQPPPQTPMPSAPTYPPYAGTDVSPVSAPSTQYQPPRPPPVEESLIEL